MPATRIRARTSPKTVATGQRQPLKEIKPPGHNARISKRQTSKTKAAPVNILDSSPAAQQATSQMIPISTTGAPDGARLLATTEEKANDTHAIVAEMGETLRQLREEMKISIAGLGTAVMILEQRHIKAYREMKIALLQTEGRLSEQMIEVRNSIEEEIGNARGDMQGELQMAQTALEDQLTNVQDALEDKLSSMDTDIADLASSVATAGLDTFRLLRKMDEELCSRLESLDDR